MSRWEERELKALEQMRSALKKEKAAHIPYPDGITDTQIFEISYAEYSNNWNMT